MNATNTMLLSVIANGAVQPSLIEEVNDNLMYVGYCLPTTTGTDDDTWMIKRIMKEGKVQSITYPNGLMSYNQAWDNRAELKYKYSEEQVIRNND